MENYELGQNQFEEAFNDEANEKESSPVVSRGRVWNEKVAASSTETVTMEASPINNADGEQPSILRSRLNTTMESGDDTSLSSPRVAHALITTESKSAKKILIYEKELSSSDVGDYNRLVISRKFAEAHFPCLEVKEMEEEEEEEESEEDEENMGKKKINNVKEYKKEILKFLDNDKRVWEMKFLYWRKSQSFALTKGWKGFVVHHRLRVRDKIRIYKLGDEESGEAQFGMDHFRPRLTKSFKLFGKIITYECSDDDDHDDFSNKDGYRSSIGGRRRKRKRKSIRLFGKDITYECSDDDHDDDFKDKDGYRSNGGRKRKRKRRSKSNQNQGL